MVFPDTSSAPQSSHENSDKFHLPSVADRFLAFVIDVFLFIPVIGLFVAGQLKDVREYTLQREDSPEAFIVWILFVVSVFVLSILLQSVFSFFWGASPGQKILNLKVVSTSGKALSFPQSLLRSFFWWTSFGFFGWPFLEVFSHPKRKCFHDRASDTMVISLVSNQDKGPTVLEQQFVGSWMRLAFLVLVLFFSLYFMKVNQMVRGGLFTKEELSGKGLLCDIELPEKFSMAQRLDMLLGMQILEDGDKECLDLESDLALWNRESKDKALGYLVKVFLADDQDRKKEYQNYICENFKDSEECVTATHFVSKEKLPANELRKKGLTLLTSRVLLLKDVLADKNYISAAALIEDLMKEEALQPYLQKMYVRLVWQVREGQAARSPASAELKSFISEFKKRYEIP